MSKPTMTRGQAIKTYFNTQPHGREVSMDELKALMKNKKDFEWMGEECAKALGAELTVSAA